MGEQGSAFSFKNFKKVNLGNKNSIVIEELICAIFSP